MRDTCETCRFYSAIEESDGLCKRHAPRPRLVSKDEHDNGGEAWADWPVVEKDSWCGEFESMDP